MSIAKWWKIHIDAFYCVQFVCFNIGWFVHVFVNWIDGNIVNSFAEFIVQFIFVYAHLVCLNFNKLTLYTHVPCTYAAANIRLQKVYRMTIPNTRSPFYWGILTHNIWKINKLSHLTNKKIQYMELHFFSYLTVCLLLVFFSSFILFMIKNKSSE